MKKYYSFAVLIFVFFFACKTERKQSSNSPFSKIAEGNIFSDKIIRDIYTFQYHRNTNSIIKILKGSISENFKYKKHCILSLASIQDTTSISVLADFLYDKNKEIRQLAAYAIGQIESPLSESKLLDAFLNESSLLVKEEILQAIGKCGTQKGLSFIEKITYDKNKKNILKGKIMGLAKFAERNIVSDSVTNEIFAILRNPKMDEKIKYLCSWYLLRSNIDLNRYSNKIISVYPNSGYIYTKSNIIKLCSKSRKPAILKFLKKILKSKKNDYRLRVDAIKSSKIFGYNEMESIMNKLLRSRNIHIAITAADFFIEKGNKNSSKKYYSIAKKMSVWQTRTKMFKAALKYADNKKDISKAIMSGYEASEDVYEKSSLIEALSFDISKYEYVSEIVFDSDNHVVRTAGINSLSLMRHSKDFNKYKVKLKTEKGISLDAEFAEIFKKAILSGDIALMSIAASVIREPKFKHNLIYKNTFFITQAIDKCLLPRDYEAYVSLLKADKFINGTKNQIKKLDIKYKTIDWDLIKSIPPEQKIKIFTDKGNFVIQLKVNNSPFSVSTFVDLIIDGFFNDHSFHRVVPNFVIQDGCPRGDGWGNVSFAIRSEYPPIKYEEGIVGLASSGKDTESSQWFITNTMTPHLEGKYSVIGIVVAGLDVIHKIQIGDKIKKIKILK